MIQTEHNCYSNYPTGLCHSRALLCMRGAHSQQILGTISRHLQHACTCRCCNLCLACALRVINHAQHFTCARHINQPRACKVTTRTPHNYTHTTTQLLWYRRQNNIIVVETVRLLACLPAWYFACESLCASLFTPLRVLLMPHAHEGAYSTSCYAS